MVREKEPLSAAVAAAAAAVVANAFLKVDGYGPCFLGAYNNKI